MMSIVSPTIKAVIGLGNPGSRFTFHRHNIGFRVVDALAQRHGGTWKKKGSMEICAIVVNDKPLLLVKPQTFMNSSGTIISALAQQGITADTLIVVHDELEKPFGSLAFKEGGSHRGHNGLRSIIQHAGDKFMRLRVGIGRPENKEEVPDYVLSSFTENKKDVEELIEKAVVLLEQKLG